MFIWFTINVIYMDKRTNALDRDWPFSAYFAGCFRINVPGQVDSLFDFIVNKGLNISVIWGGWGLLHVVNNAVVGASAFPFIYYDIRLALRYLHVCEEIFEGMFRSGHFAATPFRSLCSVSIHGVYLNLFHGHQPCLFNCTLLQILGWNSSHHGKSCGKTDFYQRLSAIISVEIPCTCSNFMWNCHRVNVLTFQPWL
jgi:hypothetical protein